MPVLADAIQVLRGTLSGLTSWDRDREPVTTTAILDALFGSASFTIRLILSILSSVGIPSPRTGPVIHISLPDAEVEQLEERLCTTPDAKLRHRVQIVLMAHRGRRHPAIAAHTGTSARSVQRWLNAYLDRGLDGLAPRKAKGAPPRLTADLAPVLRP